MPFEKVSDTLKNLEAALAGESQAHIKYRYFAKIAREEGFEDVAKHFEHTADQEILHAWGHLELLVGKPTTKQCLEMAIEGETHEFTIMYPGFEEQARTENNRTAQLEFASQVAESSEHAEQFKAVLAKAEKRFAALAKVEKRHASAYQKMLEEVQ
jgi:rubrerythrin